MSDEEFAERVTAMTQTLYRVCYAQLSQACDREDAVQEAICAAYASRGSLRDPARFRPWILKILVNKCYEFCRKRRTTVDLADVQDFLPLNECHNIQRRAARLQPCATLPERAAAPQPMGTTRVGEALLELEEKLRMPLVLHYMEGYSVADVAAVLRIPQGTVKTRLRRGREALKALLTPPIGGVSRDPG